jgi:hypothetical protein
MLNPLYYSYLADLIVATHLVYVSYVVLGQVLILLGIALRWSWIRVRWFRISHLIMIWIVAVEAVFGVTCPLTTWENQVRRWANQPYDDRSFIGRCMDHLLFVNYSAPVVVPPQEAAPSAPDTEVTPEPAPDGGAAAEEERELDLTAAYLAFALLTTLTYILAPPRCAPLKTLPLAG